MESSTDNSLNKQVMEIINNFDVEKGADLVTDGAISIIGLGNPVLATFLEVVKNTSKVVDDYKVSMLIRQFGKNLNMEQLKNRLVNYIKNDDKKAMQIVDIFRKTLLSESRIAITIMGLILGKNINNNTNMSRDDLIISKALDNATDMDLYYFYILIQSKIIKNRDKLTDEEILTCEWCVYNRIFKEHVMEWNVQEYYTITEAGEKLFSYIQKVPLSMLEEAIK